MIVVSDTSPICYLLLIGEIDILGQIYGQVLIPEIVQKELADTRSPDMVQTWIQIPPKYGCFFGYTFFIMGKCALIYLSN